MKTFRSTGQDDKQLHQRFVLKIIWFSFVKQQLRSNFKALSMYLKTYLVYRVVNKMETVSKNNRLVPVMITLKNYSLPRSTCQKQLTAVGLLYRVGRVAKRRDNCKW